MGFQVYPSSVSGATAPLLSDGKIAGTIVSKTAPFPSIPNAITLTNGKSYIHYNSGVGIFPVNISAAYPATSFFQAGRNVQLVSNNGYIAYSMGTVGNTNVAGAHIIDTTGTAGQNQSLTATTIFNNSSNNRTAAVPPVTSVWRAAAFGAGLFVIGGTNGILYTTTDQSTWTARTSGFGSNSIAAAAHNGSTFVIVGSSGAISSSTNGITWTGRSSGTGSLLNAVYSNGSAFVAGGAGGTLVHSTDGITWTTPSTPFSGSEIFAIWFGNGRWVAVSQNGRIGTSTNGTSWSLSTSPFNSTTDLQMVGYNPRFDYWIAAGQNTSANQLVLGYSTDAITWNSNLFNITTSYLGYNAPCGNTLYFPNEGALSFTVESSTTTPYAFYYMARPTDMTNGFFPVTAVDLPNEGKNTAFGAAAFDPATYRAFFRSTTSTSNISCSAFNAISVKIWNSYAN